MDEWVLRIRWPLEQANQPEHLVTREWLVTNGLGGYASGTIGGVASRRYHGLLIAALPAPLGRQMMLNHLSELVRLLDGSTALLGGVERNRSDEEEIASTSLDESIGVLDVHGASYLTEFRLDMGLPVWRYRVQDVEIEKRILLPHGQNTVHVNYRLVGDSAREGRGTVRLKLRPLIEFRRHEDPVNVSYNGPYSMTAVNGRYEVMGPPDRPRLRLILHGERSAFTIEGERVHDLHYRVERRRGYEASGSLWSPGYFRVDLAPRQDVTLVASSEPWETILALSPEQAAAAERERRRRLLAAAPPSVNKGPAAELVLAADQFLVSPVGRSEDAARVRAAGDEMRTVIAGYHWFTDWGRDTMISLEGLTLTTGRAVEAGYILRTFAYYIRDGLIPNLFPEGEREGLYHTADATLWYFHALDRYLASTGDRITLQLLLPKLEDIVRHHLRGTRFGIGVDPSDGLLRQGAEGYQLTWMDAKVGDWVVTPRRGKAVEINALWYNALCLMARWLQEEGEEKRVRPYAEHAERARESFNQKFWYNEGGYLYDCLGEDGPDPACRPNQLFAISLPHEILDQSRWRPVLDVVTKRLLTPVGLRSLAPGHPDYKARYYGDLRNRDAAYHQGTVWAWLIGPYIDAWLKVHPGQQAEARRYLDGFVSHLSEACIGSISEIFDAEQPFTPRGCIAQAWSIAEVLRCWAQTAKKGRGGQR